LLSGIVTVTVVGLLGYYPTVRLSGDEARAALIAGCVVGLVANWIGAIPLWTAAPGDPRRRATAILMGTAVRFGAVLVLGLAAAFSGIFKNSALLIWVALSYLVVLFIDTLWLVRSDGNSVEAQA
jgi:CDP-diglyceride synthetase